MHPSAEPAEVVFGILTFAVAGEAIPGSGCPSAPGATEDLVFAFEQGGVATGIGMALLLEAADMIAALPGGQTGGHLRSVPRPAVLR